MKHFNKKIVVASLLCTLVAGNAQGQLVINYENDKGTQETSLGQILKVDKNGHSYLVNQIEINRIKYISRFISADTNEGKVSQPEGAKVNMEELTVVGDQTEVKVDKYGNFQTTANVITALNPEGKVVFRSYVTMEEGEQMRYAELNATETAVSLLMPMFSGIYQGMSDEVLERLKTLIREEPETQELAKAIDKSIVDYGYLDVNAVDKEYGAAINMVAALSGLEQVAEARKLANSNQMSRMAPELNKKVTKDGITIELTTLEEARVSYYNSLRGADVECDGYKGTVDVWNHNRLSYSWIIKGIQTLDERVMATNFQDNYALLPPMRMGQIVKSNSTWGDIRNILKGDNTGSTDFDGVSKTSGVPLDFSSADDAVMVMGPASNDNLAYYNRIRVLLPLVISDMVNTSDNGKMDCFYSDFDDFSRSVSMTMTLPNYDNPDEPITDSAYYLYARIMENTELSDDQKTAKCFEIFYQVLKQFISQRNELQLNVSNATKNLLEKMSSPAAQKVFNNYDFYLTVVQKCGTKVLGLVGLKEGDVGIHIEGLDIVHSKPTLKDLYDDIDGVYNKYVELGNRNGELFYKPMWFAGTHSTLDTQVTGWEKYYNTQQYQLYDEGMAGAFDNCYRIISAANEFLADYDQNPASSVLEGEALALRSFCYMFLAENWGRLPLRDRGETLDNIWKKPYAEELEVWDFIIENLKRAADLLDWQPRGGEGHCTKGMALSYLAEAYLWKAYKQRLQGIDDMGCLLLAKNALKQVIDSGFYELAESYSTLWDGKEAWSKEAIWQFSNEMNPDASNIWGRNDWAFMSFYSASPESGGWGSLYCSWEIYFLFEQGDKRRDASFCTGQVNALPQQYRGVGYGYNPFTQQSSSQQTTYKFFNGESAPAIWSMKYWRLSRAGWSNSTYSPVHIYFKRFAGVLLDYAECLFRLNGGDDAEAWAIVDQIRNRAFGNLEVGKADDLTRENIEYYNRLAWLGGDYPNYTGMTSYPIPFNTSTVTFEDAKTYYTRMTKEGLSIDLANGSEVLCLPFNMKAEPWQVALGQERRKEFNTEWNLRADLQRMDFMQTHMECNYPMNLGSEYGVNDWHTYRNWVFNPERLKYPIPQRELERNPYAIQNVSY